MVVSATVEKFTRTCVWLWMVTDTELFHLQIKRSNVNDTRERLFTVNFILILIHCLNDKFVTKKTYMLQFQTHVRESHSQPECTLQLVCENRMLFIWVHLRVSLCGQQDPTGQQAIHLVYSSFFCKLRFIQLHKQYLMELGQEIQTVTRKYRTGNVTRHYIA